MSIRRGPTFSLKMTINYNKSICHRWADLSSSLTWPAWLSSLHLGPGPSSVAPAFFRIGYQSSSLSLLWQSYIENIQRKVFVDRQALRRRLSQQLSPTNWLRCQVSERCRFCWDFLDYIWNAISFRDLDNSHDRFGQFDIPLVDAFLRFRSGISFWQLMFCESYLKAKFCAKRIFTLNGTHYIIQATS